MAESTPVKHPSYRECRTCGVVKTVDQFSRRRGGYRWDCKPCVAAARKTTAPLATDEPRKVCSKCGEAKPVSAFGSRGKDRVRGDCKPCVAAVSRRRYQESPEARSKHKALRDRWRAENPTYFADNYDANREQRIAAAVEYAKRNPVDPERRRERERAWYAANTERRRAVKAAWREANLEAARGNTRHAAQRRRARLRQLPVVPYTIAELLQRDGADCVLCERPLNLAVQYPHPMAPTIEHLECISWAESAGDTPSNVALSHWGCNNARRDKPHPAAAAKRAELLAAEAAAS